MTELSFWNLPFPIFFGPVGAAILGATVVEGEHRSS